MAIRKNNAEEPVVQSQETIPQETIQQETIPQETIPQETIPQSADMVVHQEASLPTVGGPAPSLVSLHHAMNHADLGNVLPRIVGNNGVLQLSTAGKKVTLGGTVDVQVLSHGERWMVIPISDKPNDPAVRPKCRASYDGGKTIMNAGESGARESMTVEEYAALISNEFPKGVDVKSYYDIVVAVISSAQNSELAKEAVMAQVSVSPTGIAAFKAYMATVGIRVMRGMLAKEFQDCVRVLAVPDTNSNKQDYVRMEFSSCPPEVLAGYKPIRMSAE